MERVLESHFLFSTKQSQLLQAETCTRWVQIWDSLVFHFL
jgi:hypothetical protein